MSLSSKDKARLALSAKRVLANKEKALIPWKRKAPVGSTIVAMGQEKPAISYADKATVLSAEGKARSSADKIAGGLKLDGEDRFTGKVGEYDHPDKLLCGNGEKYTPRPANTGNNASPFKRVRNSPLVVVVKK